MDRQAGRWNDVTNGQTEYAYVRREVEEEREEKDEDEDEEQEERE